MSKLSIQSQITFLYYDDLTPIADFYQNVIGLTLVEDQQWAKIYQVSQTSFLGIVDGERGFRKPQPESAVLCTFAVPDVMAWYDHLVAQGVKILREPNTYEEIQVQCFFFEDPGGYAVEVQCFLKPELEGIFHR
ncbi:MAG: VOC family protein [Chloroflexota bacterium]